MEVSGIIRGHLFCVCVCPAVVVCIPGRSVHSDAPWWLSGSVGVAGLIRVRSGSRRVHSGSFGSFRCALGVVGFIWRRWVPSCTLWGSFGVVGYFLMRPVGFKVYFGSLGTPCGSSGSLWDVVYFRVRPAGRQVHSGTFGCALRVVLLIRGRWGVPWGSVG